MRNGVPNLDFPRTRDQYEAINQQNSSYRQSLLVSPYCSKFSKQSPRQSIRNQLNINNSLIDNSLLDYIQPFESDQLNKTQTKQKLRKRVPYQNQSRKRTQPNFQQNQYTQNNNRGLIEDLKQIIKLKDRKIVELERNVAELNDKLMAKTQVTHESRLFKNPYQISSSKNNLQYGSKQKHNKNASHLGSQQKQNYQYMEVQLQNYKKQLRFLTCNNQQLYQQLQKLGEYCVKLKQALYRSLIYSQDLQIKVAQLNESRHELQQLNNTLLRQKQQMMQNYKIQIQLFNKMKKLWHDQNKQQLCKRNNEENGDGAKQKSFQKSGKNGKRCHSSKPNVLKSSINQLKL